MSTKTTTTTTDSLEEERQQVQGIKDSDGGGSGLTTSLVNINDNGVLIFLAFMLLIVTLSCLYLVAVLF